MSKPCKTCGVVNGHRIGCQRSIARAALIKAVIDWHHASHRVPSRNADQTCAAQPGTAWWFDSWGRRIVRCTKHYREAAGNAARALGWEVHKVEGT